MVGFILQKLDMHGFGIVQNWGSGNRLHAWYWNFADGARRDLRSLSARALHSNLVTVVARAVAAAAWTTEGAWQWPRLRISMDLLGNCVIQLVALGTDWGGLEEKAAFRRTA